MSSHVVRLDHGHVLNRFTTENKKPRPESYREDYNLAKSLPQNEAEQLHAHIAAAAESGADFSTRWFSSGHELKSIHTIDIIPVDLNAILCKFESNMVFFNNELKRTPTVDYAAAIAKRKEAMNAYLWDSTTHQWYDYCLKSQRQLRKPYPANWLPVWSGVHDEKDEDLKAKILESFLKSGLIQAAGVLSSEENSGQQWDSPNAWAPHQSLIVHTLLALDTADSRELAKKIAIKWTKTSFIGYQTFNHFMHEKYNAFQQGYIGGGGEYTTQIGFGWTNGVALEFLNMYRDISDE